MLLGIRSRDALRLFWEEAAARMALEQAATSRQGVTPEEADHS
jgi:hypothetical protein